jgi:hypothetical protein
VLLQPPLHVGSLVATGIAPHHRQRTAAPGSADTRWWPQPWCFGYTAAAVRRRPPPGPDTAPTPVWARRPGSTWACPRAPAAAPVRLTHRPTLVAICAGPFRVGAHHRHQLRDQPFFPRTPDRGCSSAACSASSSAPGSTASATRWTNQCSPASRSSPPLWPDPAASSERSQSQSPRGTVQQLLQSLRHLRTEGRRAAPALRPRAQLRPQLPSIHGPDRSTHTVGVHCHGVGDLRDPPPRRRQADDAGPTMGDGAAGSYGLMRGCVLCCGQATNVQGPHGPLQ